MQLILNRLVFCFFISVLLLTWTDEPCHGKRGKHKSTKAAIQEYGKAARDKLKPFFDIAKIKYPPEKLTFICIKDEKLLHIFAEDQKGKNKLVISYPIVDASGTSGPKLQEGDKQVPEGFYRLTGFKPDSIAHLALMINYPNEEDKRNARVDKRGNLGCDIEIHGSYWSTGCLAMGDPAIEEIFVLAYDTGLKNIKLIFAPSNLNIKEPELKMSEQPKWLPGLYDRLKSELADYPIVPLKTKDHNWDTNAILY